MSFSYGLGGLATHVGRLEVLQRQRCSGNDAWGWGGEKHIRLPQSFLHRCCLGAKPFLSLPSPTGASALGFSLRVAVGTSVLPCIRDPSGSLLPLPLASGGLAAPGLGGRWRVLRYSRSGVVQLS